MDKVWKFIPSRYLRATYTKQEDLTWQGAKALILGWEAFCPKGQAGRVDSKIFVPVYDAENGWRIGSLVKDLRK